MALRWHSFLSRRCFTPKTCCASLSTLGSMLCSWILPRSGSTRCPYTCWPLANGCWPLLQHLNLSGTNLGNYRMAALPLRKWPKLKTSLNQMKDCNLDRDSIGYLTAASWPCLEHLQLLGNWLMPATAAILWKVDWPHVTRLDLCGLFFGSVYDH